MTKPAKTAPTAKKQLTDISTNHVNSKPSNVVDLLSEMKRLISTEIEKCIRKGEFYEKVNFTTARRTGKIWHL